MATAIDEVRVQGDAQSVEALARELTAEATHEMHPPAAPAAPGKRRPGRPPGIGRISPGKRKRKREPAGARAARAARARENGGPRASIDGKEKVPSDYTRAGEQPPPPPDDAQAAADAMQQAARDIAPIVELAIGSYVDRRWPAQPYTYEEAEILSAATLAVAGKYGGWLERYAAEVTLACVCVVQFAGRAREEAKQKNAAAASEVL